MVCTDLSVVPTVIEVCDVKMRAVVSGGTCCNSCGKVRYRSHGKLPRSASTGKHEHLLVYVRLFSLTRLLKIIINHMTSEMFHVRSRVSSDTFPYPVYLVLGQGYTNFPEVLEPYLNFRH